MKENFRCTEATQIQKPNASYHQKEACKTTSLINTSSCQTETGRGIQGWEYHPVIKPHIHIQVWIPERHTQLTHCRDNQQRRRQENRSRRGEDLMAHGIGNKLLQNLNYPVRRLLCSWTHRCLVCLCASSVWVGEERGSAGEVIFGFRGAQDGGVEAKRSQLRAKGRRQGKATWRIVLGIDWHSFGVVVCIGMVGCCRCYCVAQW